MEMKLDQKSIRYLENIMNDHKKQEQTQEIKLSNDLPDIGSILGAWGQCFVRGKQWLGNGVEVSGGTKVWVIYKADQTEEINCVETWIPFQFSWELHTYEPDGMINATCNVCAIDVRNTSSRKMILRTDIAMFVDIYTEKETYISVQGECCENIQCLKREHNLFIPKEVGEKTFSIDEDLTIPASYPQVSKILKYQMRLEITDKKVITQKVVFRGTAIICISYLGTDGAICCWECEVPFSQYSDLDVDFDEGCYILLEPMLSGLEVGFSDENKISVTAGVICQYSIYGYESILVTQDAYCPGMNTDVHDSALIIPTLLDHKDELVHMDHNIDVPANRVVDVSVSLGKPITSYENENTKIMLPCDIKVLYYDTDAVLRSEHISVQKILRENCHSSAKTRCYCVLSGSTRATVGVSGCNAGFDVLVCNLITTDELIQMVTGVEIMEKAECCKRPSLILCRKEDGTLWDIAKRYGSTVEMIERINCLQSEPDTNKLLIVPIA